METITRLTLLLCLLSAVPGVKMRQPAKLTARPACPFPQAVPNGSFRLRRNNQVMRVSCSTGYQLQGDRIIECIKGKWVGQKPVCAKSGCDLLTTPETEHGFIQYDTPYRMVLFCMDDYNLAGNRYAYCNGTHWDRPIGNCREPSYNVEHECDFETDDICGWVHEEGIGTQWQRVSAMNVFTSYHTGPRHDHTLSSMTGGHYMLMETVDASSQPAYLQSPIYERELSLKTACCFRFFYFMYGAGVGDLSVYVRPVSVKMSEMLNKKDKYEKFYKSGNQNNLWNQGNFSISEMDNDFQIVFVATAGKNHLSDIAIDDVKLMTGEDCAVFNEDGSASEEDFTTDLILFDEQSCDGHCFESHGSGFVRIGGKYYGRCNCDYHCEYDESCCPDFRLVCLNSFFAQSTEISDEISNSFEASTETVTCPLPGTSTTILFTTEFTTTTTTTSTTTTTPKPTTTTKTITTTTPKSTTISTTKATTTTSTTPKRMQPTRRMPNLNTVNGTSHPTKEEIAVWRKIKSSTSNQNLPHPGRIMLAVFLVALIAILAGTVIYRYKNHMAIFLRGAENNSDVETTSISTKFRFNPKYTLRSNRRTDDTENLLDGDIEAENEANFGIDNKLPIGKKTTKANTTVKSISTNL